MIGYLLLKNIGKNKINKKGGKVSFMKITNEITENSPPIMEIVMKSIVLVILWNLIQYLV